ncbi:histidine phosphatase family protein [Microbacterium sp. W4I20]|uniref:histidine phosphatase family protein n=1 Tax=Microbacterium sp. W4I20 TaxID=3042262 RepID=UPI002780AE39|nr:histidine phosphatase family protein [Microbacterium sp. W4I20]MDQ0728301.1 putative phosphoglycerate mutase [Microbacterium sp. W4I20]
MGSLEELWLVRHGESVGNLAATGAEVAGAEAIELADRDADVPLSATGIAQARALAAPLLAATERPQIAWLSPYLRAQQTFALSVENGPAIDQVLTDERLRDRELGILDLLTWRGVAARHPEEAARRARLGKYYHRPPGGESWADVALRLRSFLHDTADADARVGLVVAHDAVVMLLISLLTGMDEPHLMKFAASNTVLNASVTRLRVEEGRWQLVDFSDVRHLAELGADITVHPGSPDVQPA